MRIAWLFSVCVVHLVRASLLSPSACATTPNLGPLVWSQDGRSGVCFRVWAPHASSAAVVPKSTATAAWPQTSMNKSAVDGAYYAFVAGVQTGDAYVYVFDSSVTRLDPRAQGTLPYLVRLIHQHGQQGIGPGSTSWPYSIVYDPDSFEWDDSELTFRAPTPAEAVVYEMHIPSFNAGSGSAGTFASAEKKLDYLASLGINMIELMPVATFGGTEQGWGYNPCAPFAPMQAYGGPDGLKSFVNAANSRGIGVMLDIVFNHADSRTILKDFDGYQGGAGNGIYFYEDAKANTPWGPRYAYATDNVTQFLLNNLEMFIKEYHISGFRWDSTVCIRKGGEPGVACWNTNDVILHGYLLLQKGNNLTHQLLPSAVTVAEDDQGWPDISLPTTDMHAGVPGAPGGAGFNAQWGYKGWFYAFFAGLTADDNGDVDMSGIAALLSSSTEGPRVLFTENHDMASNQNHGRIPHIVDPAGSPTAPSYWAQKKAMLGIGAVLTAPGIPMLLQGQAMLTYASFLFPVPPPLDWSLVSDNAGMIQEVADMISVRRNLKCSALMGSGAKVVQLEDTSTRKIAVIHRWSTSADRAHLSRVAKAGSHDALVVYNMYNAKYMGFILTNLPYDGAWSVAFNGDLKKYSSQYGNVGSGQTSITVSGGSASIDIPEYSILILVRDNL